MGEFSIRSEPNPLRLLKLANSWTAQQELADDIALAFGTDSDIMFLNRSTLLAADAEVTNIIEGTSEHPGVAANSLIISNITNDGDILLLVSKAGNSQGALWLDGSSGDTAIMASSSASVDHYIAGTKVLDHSSGAFAFQENTTISSTATLTLGAITLSGAIAGGDQAFTNVGDMTFAAGSILASGGTNGNTLLLRANDTTFITLTTGATDTMNLGAFTADGNISVGANKVIFTDVSLKREAEGRLAVRNAGDTADADFRIATAYVENCQVSIAVLSPVFRGSIDGAEIRAADVNGDHLKITARDTGVGQVEIARLVGAADPYLQVGRDDTGVALSAVTDGLVLQMGGGTGNEAAGFGFGLSVKLGNAASQVEERASLDMVLQTATDGSEDASFIYKAMVAGAMATVLSFGGYAGVAKLGFYATAPVALQTGVAVTAAGIHAALVNLGLITA